MDRVAVRRTEGRAARWYGIVGALTVAAGVVGVPPPDSAPQPKVADVALTSGLALVLGPSGIPQPSLEYVQAAQNLYLDPNGFTGTAASFFTPETLGAADPDAGVAESGTDATVTVDVADLVGAVKAAIDGHVTVQSVSGNPEALVDNDFDGTRYGTAENPLWVFGYSQSATAASIAMSQLHNDPATANSVIHFVLVGDPAASQAAFDAGQTAGTGLLNSPFAAALNTLFPGAAAILHVATVIGLTTPNDAYPTDVYTLANDPFADFPYSSFPNVAEGGAPGPDNLLGSIVNFVSGLVQLPRFFLPQYGGLHEDYLSLTPAAIENDAVSVPDGEVMYHVIADSGINQIAAALLAL